MTIKTSTIGKGINTVAGLFKPGSSLKDSTGKTPLLPALIAAAESVKYTEFDVQIDGHLFTTAESLPCKYLEDLIQDVTVVSVTPKDSAA
jgi:hypothetical protein